MEDTMFPPRRIAAGRHIAGWLLALMLATMLGCATTSSNIQDVRMNNIVAARDAAVNAPGDADAAIRYADALASGYEDDFLRQQPLEEGGPDEAMNLLGKAARRHPKRVGDLKFAEGKLKYAMGNHDAGIEAWTANTMDRGHAFSAVHVAEFHADTGNRDRLKSFCDEAVDVVQGGDDKHTFITTCVKGMGLASASEWEALSAEGLETYQRQNANYRAEKEEAERQERQRAAELAREALEPECKMQSNGKNVCGYHCETGSNGRVYCADTPDGKCSLNSDGTYSCTRLADSRTSAGATEEPECKLQSNGKKVCGYNCKLGSNGRAYCSSVPNGECSLNSDGTYSCP
jgi:hypothetical protein